jgi:hypothetical protein
MLVPYASYEFLQDILQGNKCSTKNFGKYSKPGVKGLINRLFGQPGLLTLNPTLSSLALRSSLFPPPPLDTSIKEVIKIMYLASVVYRTSISIGPLSHFQKESEAENFLVFHI